MTIDLDAWPRPGVRTRVMIIVIIFLVSARWAPDAVLPLGLGAGLAAWLPAGEGRA
jgi:hypothetical protein